MHYTMFFLNFLSSSKTFCVPYLDNPEDQLEDMACVDDVGCVQGLRVVALVEGDQLEEQLQGGSVGGGGEAEAGQVKYEHMLK